MDAPRDEHQEHLEQGDKKYALLKTLFKKHDTSGGNPRGLTLLLTALHRRHWCPRS